MTWVRSRISLKFTFASTPSDSGKVYSNLRQILSETCVTLSCPLRLASALCLRLLLFCFLLKDWHKSNCSEFQLLFWEAMIKRELPKLPRLMDMVAADLHLAPRALSGNQLQQVEGGDWTGRIFRMLYI